MNLPGPANLASVLNEIFNQSLSLTPKKTLYALDQSKFPGLMQMADTLRANHRFAADIVDRGAALFGEQWAIEFEQVLSALFPSAKALEAAIKGYATFAMHSMRLQAVFERDRQYKTKTHEQASSEVYFNEKHMMQEYLPGLLFSHH